MPALGAIEHCELLRRGFNEVYEVRAATGHYVARLSALRARGPSNVPYEMAQLSHLALQGAGVAEGVAGPLRLELPEGARDLAVFRYVEGASPESAADFGVTGEGLALLHQAAEGYAGPPSRYTLDLDHLVRRPLGWLLEAPTMDGALRDEFALLAEQVLQQIGDAQGLTRVACHGDCHGGNNFIHTAQDGRPGTSFFDFDDSGPGWLAYDLCVLLWALLPRRIEPELSEEVATKYGAFLDGYRRTRAVPEVDLDAIPLFLAVRNIWLLGEFASRRHHWGSQALPTAWLRKQVPIMRSWISLREVFRTSSASG